MAIASNNEYPSVLFDEQAGDVSTPGSGLWRVYTKSDGLYVIDDAGSVTGPLAAASAGTVLDPQEQTLTNEAIGGTGAYEQWGTEEITFSGLGGSDVVVDAMVIGYLSVQNVDGATFDTKIQVSFDAGSGWTDGTSVTTTVTVGNNRMRLPLSAGGVKTGTASGDVMIRAMVQASSTTNSPTWANGLLIARCNTT